MKYIIKNKFDKKINQMQLVILLIRIQFLIFCEYCLNYINTFIKYKLLLILLYLKVYANIQIPKFNKIIL